MTDTENQPTKPEQAGSPAVPLFGLGVRILPAEHKVELFFEADGMAEDEFGNPTPAGVKIGMEIRPEVPLKSVAEYEDAAARIERTGIPSMKLAGKFRRITPEQYVAAGYDDE